MTNDVQDLLREGIGRIPADAGTAARLPGRARRLKKIRSVAQSCLVFSAA